MIYRRAGHNFKKRIKILNKEKIINAGRGGFHRDRKQTTLTNLPLICRVEKKKYAYLLNIEVLNDLWYNRSA